MDKTNSVETNMGIMAEKISNIEKVMTAIQVSLDIVLKNYIQRAEVDSRFQRLQEELDKRMAGAHKRIDECITTVHHAESMLVLKESHRDSLKPIIADIEDFKEDKKWLYRLVFGAIIMAVLGLVITIK